MESMAEPLETIERDLAISNAMGEKDKEVITTEETRDVEI